ncbi:MAG: heavy metal translocating P-type ATPase [Oscillospiraceae bacterium]
MKNVMEKLEKILDLGGTKKDIVFLAVSGAALLISLLCPELLPFNTAWIAIVLCGIPIIFEAIIGLVTAFDIKADVLVSLALIASVCIGEDFAAGEVAFIMQLGSLLEDLTVAKARAGIEKLVRLQPRTARIISDRDERIVSADEVAVGDILRVLPGETIPVDGIIVSGETSVDQAVMTGESLPVDKTVGDDVSSGTLNRFGVFEMRASKVGADSSIQRMIQLVRSADAGKAKIVGIADRWATWIVVIALTAAAVTWAVSGEIIRAVTILVVFCPCALVLATPTAIMAAIGNATKHGFLVREGDALERLASVSKICFDKTGTLTYGVPCVTNVKSVSCFSEEKVYHLTASAEQYSEHPLGRAIVSCYGKETLSAENFRMTAGRGVSAQVEGFKVFSGNEEFMMENGIVISDEVKAEADEYFLKGGTVIFTAADGVLAGYLVLSDTLRKEASDIIMQLNKIGMETVLLTGDNEKSAGTIAAALGIKNVNANCLPENKLDFIKALQEQNKEVCMIGDGINDAPALKMANVGIAMGGIGSDIAVDAADIALVDDEIKELPHLIMLSKHMMTTIKINLTFSMALNFLAIVLAILGILDPVVGALVHNSGSVLVIVNSALLLNWKKKI